MNLLTNSDYQSFRQLSTLQINALTNISNPQGSLDSLKQNAPHYRHDIAVIAQNLNQIQQSVNSYSAISSAKSANYSNLSTIKKIQFLVRKFINFLNKTDFKVKTLQKSLPTLISAATSARSEADQALTAEELKAETESITKKLDLVNRVRQRLLQDNSNPKWNRTAREVNAYIQNKFNRLNHGIDVALPDFYHSTKDGYFDSIIKDKKIKQSTDGKQGPGVYISTNIEYFFGPYAFTLETSAVNYPAKFESGMPNIGRSNSIWICVREDIKVMPITVAHITVKSSKERRSMDGRLRKLQLDTPVVTRKTSYCINDLFDKVQKRQLPKSWQNNYEKGRPLPQNLEHNP